MIEPPFPFNGNAALKPALVGVPVKVERIPPHNEAAERSVLGGCLLNLEVMDAVREFLKPEDFWSDAHGHIYRAMLTLRGQNAPVDQVTVKTELERVGAYYGAAGVGGDSTYTDLMVEIDQLVEDLPSTVNCLFHADMVRQLAESRRLIELSSRVIDRAYSKLYTAGQQFDFLCRETQKLMEVTTVPDEDFFQQDFPELPGPKAYWGPLGNLVKVIEPQSEASPAAIMMQFLTAFGNMVGRAPHWKHEATAHHLNLYTCIVGPTSVGCKGTSWGYVESHFPAMSPEWASRISSGVNSGEALVELVADESMLKGGGLVRAVDDKRLLMLETEFSRILAIFTRQGDSLSMMLRQFWESGNNAARSRKQQLQCTGAHVSLIAHIPPEELNTRLSLTDVANGLGNRFIWVWSIKSKDLDEGGKLDGKALSTALGAVRNAFDNAVADVHYRDHELGRTPLAQKLWKEASAELKEPRPGHMGAMLARARPQVMRMAAIFAVADGVYRIDVPHLEAALELWAYSVRSVEWIFGERLGDKDAEKLIAAIRSTQGEGLSQTDVSRKVFKGNVPAEKIGRLLTRMMQSGLIHKTAEATAGSPKPITRWFLGPAAAHKSDGQDKPDNAS